MEFLSQILDFFLHLDKHLSLLISDYGAGTYIILFLIIFVETGLVIMPFLPGDSLLFAAGAFAASRINESGVEVAGPLNILYLIVLLSIAAVLGDALNYMIGNYIGPKVFMKDYKFLKKEYLQKTEQFYEKHGPKTIIIARFIPIIRTFAPFIAGIGTMKYSKFFAYNVIGGVLWVTIFTIAGYLFGELPIIKKNMVLVIFAIIIISLLPPIIEYIKQKRTSKA